MPTNFALPELEFVFEIRCDIGRELAIGRGADEALSFTPVTGGTVHGPRLKGEVLGGGGDWAVERSGTAQLEARYIIRTDDGHNIDILNRGYFRATTEILDRMESGENVPEDADGLYFKMSSTFQTDAPKYKWLTENQFLGSARDEDGQVCVRVFLVN